MKLHANAALSLSQRRRLARRVVDEGWSLGEAAAAAEVSERTASKWVRRYRAEGGAGLLDRSSAPRNVANRTPERRVEAIGALRRLRLTGPEIALCLGMAVSTVSGILTRSGLGRLWRLEPPARRYERSRPGELIHIDVKKLGRVQHVGHRVTGSRRKRSATRGAGWEFVHVCVDDATRLAYVEVLDDERPTTAVGFLRRAVAFYASHGISVERLLTDNGNAYRSTLHAIALPRSRDQASPHAPLQAANQRQGRALHPHHARRLGLRRHLPQLPRTTDSAIRLARVL